MRDYEELFAMNLRDKIKERIKGKVFCKVIEDDTLVVKINCDEVHFERTWDNFSTRLITGFSTDDVATEVFGAYSLHLYNIIQGRFYY